MKRAGTDDPFPLLSVSVKHLNPRQGITTVSLIENVSGKDRLSVKHLNPRQGITTAFDQSPDGVVGYRQCETPKSPPGDYNVPNRMMAIAVASLGGVKHLNPRQGITTPFV